MGETNTTSAPGGGGDIESRLISAILKTEHSRPLSLAIDDNHVATFPELPVPEK
jgi:hypothetical protein